MSFVRCVHIQEECLIISSRHINLISFWYIYKFHNYFHTLLAQAQSTRNLPSSSPIIHFPTASLAKETPREQLLHGHYSIFRVTRDGHLLGNGRKIGRILLASTFLYNQHKPVYSMKIECSKLLIAWRPISRTRFLLILRRNLWLGFLPTPLCRHSSWHLCLTRITFSA